jgi:uncharacterized membrane protein YphA (DoxX/SURF4 family)
MRLNKIIIGSICAYALAAIFFIAGLSKVILFNDFLNVVVGYKLFPMPRIPYLAVALIGIEMTIAICLVLPYFRAMGALGAAGIFLFFITLVFYAQLRGLNVECGCFAFMKKQIVGLGLLFQDTILLGLALIVYKLDKQNAVILNDH